MRSARSPVLATGARLGGRRSSSFSSVVRPSERVPSSGSACRTQFQIDCADGSNSRDSSSGVRPPRTRSTICCRYSGEYGVELPGRLVEHLRAFGSNGRAQNTIPSSARRTRSVHGDRRRAASRQHVEIREQGSS